MSNKQFFAIVDTETTINHKVYDFGCIVVDRQGKVYQQISVVVNEFKNEELFHDYGNTSFFAKKNLKDRHLNYEKMLQNGQRSFASVAYINNWLGRIIEQYGNSISLTAYNISFDIGKCNNSGINLNVFKNNFCLWGLACKLFASRRAYIKFCIKNKYFSEKLNMRTNAEIMSEYITGNKVKEPHTALEDALYFELPILVQALRMKKGTKSDGYNWRKYQLPLMVEQLGIKL